MRQSRAPSAARFPPKADDNAAAGGHDGLYQDRDDFMRVEDESGVRLGARRSRNLHAAAEQGQ